MALNTITLNDHKFLERGAEVINTIVVRECTSYLWRMSVLRHLTSCLALALIFALSTNSLALAANNVAHQTHCIDAFSETAQEPVIDEAHGHGHMNTNQDHEHEGLVAKHTMPDHDHETCLMHACPALSFEAAKLHALAELPLMKVSWPEQLLHALERPDGLKRPPKT